MKIFRDPIHNVIDLSTGDEKQNQLISDLIDSPEFQRLRFIKQLGLTYISYPSANHSRFEHSLGVAFLAKRFINKILSIKKSVLSNYENTEHFHTLYNFFEETKKIKYKVIIAALLHDIGHGPLSHVLEDIINAHHEDFTKKIILENTNINKVLSDYDKNLVTDICYLLFSKNKNPYTKLISGQLDIDKMDYLLRDSHFTGSSYGSFDLEWLLNVITVGIINNKPEIGLDLGKGLSVAEDFIMARMYMFRNVYLHKTTIIAQNMLKLLFDRSKELSHVFENFQELKNIIFNNKIMLDEYLSLTDIDIFYFIKIMTKNQDAILSQISTDLLDRNLFKEVLEKPSEISKYNYIEINTKNKKNYLSKPHDKIYLFDKNQNNYSIDEKSLISINDNNFELLSGVFCKKINKT